MQQRASSCAAVASLCDFDAVIQVQLKQLVEDADDKVFACVLHNQEHVLHTLLPGTTEIPFPLGLDAIISFSTLRTVQLLNAILLLK